MKTLITLILFILCSFCISAQNPLLLKQATSESGPTLGVGGIVNTKSGYTFYSTIDYNNPFSNQWGLWRTDGTVAGTKKISLTDGQFNSTEATILTPLGNNKIVFAGDNIETYGEIWVTDGKQSGTHVLENFTPGPSTIPIKGIASLGNTVVYAVINNNQHLQIKKTDGTQAGISIVYDFGITTNSLAYFKTINGVLYFELNNSITLHNEIWRTDGTTAGTYQVKDLGLDYGFASDFMTFNNKIYFITISSTYGDYIWKSDGTTAGTAQLKQISTSFQQDNLFPAYAATSTALYLSLNDGTHGKELWKTDGTAAGTDMVSDFYPGSTSSNPYALATLNDTLYFAAADPTYGSELRKYDAQNITLVKDINPGIANGGIATITPVGNTLIFSAAYASQGEEFWTSDGSEENTFEIEDIDKTGGANGSYPRLFSVKDTVAFFAAKYDINQDGMANEECVFKYTLPDKFWRGAISGDPSVADNWFPSGAPAQTSTDDVIVPASSTHNITSPFLFIHSFFNNGDTVDVNGGLLFVNGDFFNEGTINNATGGVLAIVPANTGVTTTHLVGSSGIYNGQLTVSGGSNVRLTANSYFPTLRFEGADLVYLGDYNLQTDGFSLNLGMKAVTDGTGKFFLPVGASNVLFNVSTDSASSSPVTINNSGDYDYFGVNVKNGVFSKGTSGDTITQEAVNKTWNIFEALYGGSNATITFQWSTADELPLFDRSSIYVSHYINGAWDNGSLTSASGTNPYTATRTGITSFSPFTITSSATILPVNFVNIHAQLVNRDAVLTWQTANEINVAYYNVQRSMDGKTFTTINSISKLNNNTGLHTYTFTDGNVADIFNAKNIYYRVQETDKDGKQNFSQIVSVNLILKQPSLSIYPTPVKDLLHVSVNNFNGDSKAVIYNTNGKQLLQQNIQIGNSAVFNLNNIPAGTYFIKVYMKDGTLQGRFIKE